MSIYSYTNITSNFALMFENVGKNEMKNNVQISHQNVIPVLRSHFHKPTKNSIKSISMKRISVWTNALKYILNDPTSIYLDLFSRFFL